jgi:dextranase
MRLPLSLPLVLQLAAISSHASGVRLVDAYPDKARYAPSETVRLVVEVEGQPHGTVQISASIRNLDEEVGRCGPVYVAPDAGKTQTVPCVVPNRDYRGYLVMVRLIDAAGDVLSERCTAIDISSDWKRFPRYGYLAHYNQSEGTDPVLWMDELNRFHINGLEFYDFQYRHDQPLAGSVAHSASSWKDIAGRTVDGSVVRELIDEAHRHNMMAMAYNASYSSYDDVFTRTKDRLPLTWAIWDSPHNPRSVATAKSLELHNADGWSTRRLFYMNQNDPQWQNYLFARMRDLFAVYPFDGWHVDTFGERGGYAFDGSWVDYIDGFGSFVNKASTALHKRILFNAVGTLGQERVACSAADFVYSELWDDNETFAGILLTAEQVHYANPENAFVVAAYVHKAPEAGPVPSARQFNPPAVLLTDAAIFAAGAAHIELGDGNRMLSSEYFPADTRLSISPALHESLRHYYDFLTAYENYLRDGVEPSDIRVEVVNQPTNPFGVPNTIWTIARQKGDTTMVHLIDLLGSNDSHWRDVSMTRTEPPQLQNLQVRVSGSKKVRSVGWASPDSDGGQFHPISFRIRNSGGSEWVEFTLPELKYWDTIFIR